MARVGVVTCMVSDPTVNDLRRVLCMRDTIKQNTPTKVTLRGASQSLRQGPGRCPKRTGCCEQEFARGIIEEEVVMVGSVAQYKNKKRKRPSVPLKNPFVEGTEKLWVAVSL